MTIPIKEYIETGLVLAFHLTEDNRYEGLLYGKEGTAFLSHRELKELKKYEGIYNLLKDSERIIKITYAGGIYYLQMLDIHYEGEYNEISYYLLRDFETNDNYENLLDEYDKKQKGMTLKKK